MLNLCVTAIFREICLDCSWTRIISLYFSWTNNSYRRELRNRSSVEAFSCFIDTLQVLSYAIYWSIVNVGKSRISVLSFSAKLLIISFSFQILLTFLIERVDLLNSWFFQKQCQLHFFDLFYVFKKHYKWHRWCAQSHLSIVFVKLSLLGLKLSIILLIPLMQPDGINLGCFNSSQIMLIFILKKMWYFCNQTRFKPVPKT